MKNKKRPLISIVSILLILQIGFGSTLVAAAAASKKATIPNVSAETDAMRHAVAEALIDPALTEIEKDTSFPMELALSPTDSMIDQDPFFLRSQEWITVSPKDSSSQTTQAFEFRRTNNSVELRIPGLNGRALRLNLALHPVFANEEFIFLAPNPGSTLVEKNSEGLFLVPVSEVLSAGLEAKDAMSVPVYFFPLPGTNWLPTATADIGVKEIPHRNAIVVTDTVGVSLALSVADIRGVVKAEKFNLFFATLQGLDRSLDELKNNSSKLEKVRTQVEHSLMALTAAASNPKTKNSKTMPTDVQSQLAGSFESFMSEVELAMGGGVVQLPRGSTAGHGMLYTGFDSEHPESGSKVFTALKTQSSNPKTLWAKAFLNKALHAFGMKTAVAGDNPVTQFQNRVIGVAVKCSALFITGVVLRYTIFKKEADARIARGETTTKRTPWDIFAHSLTTMAQMPNVWPVHVLEYVLDRAHVAENGKVRKLFNATFGYVRASNSRTPVNAKTLIYGVGGLGATDTAWVAVQWYFLIPYIAKGLAIVFPFLESRVNAQYGGASASIALYNLITVMSNLVGYTTSGAYSYAHEVQEISTNEAMRLVSSKMKEEGMNPDAPANRAEYDKRVNEMVRGELAKQGLPGENAFWFDAGSLYRSAQSFFGYAAPKGADAEHYKGISRQGLMGRALSKALDAARAENKKTKSLQSLEAVSYFVQMQKKYSLVRMFLDSPRMFVNPSDIKTVALAYRDARRELVSFTKNGAPEDHIFTSEEEIPVRYRESLKIQVEGDFEVPAGYTGVGKEGYKFAAQTFRKELFHLMGVHTKAEVPDEEHQLSAKGYDPMVIEGWYAKKQINRALSRANARFASQTNLDPASLFEESNIPSAIGSKNHELWDKIFQEELLAEVNLYPDYEQPEIVAKSEKLAQEAFQDRLEKDTKFAKWYNAQSFKDQARIAAILKADQFVDQYNVVLGKEEVPALSPAQPGRFQKIRQTAWVRKSSAATKLLRFAEGVFTDSRANRGLYSKFAREWAPLLDDMWNGNMRMIRRFPAAAIFGYPYMAIVWNAALPRQAWFINFLLAGVTVAGPWTTTLRVMGKLGWKAGKEMSSMVKYATIGSFATFSGGLIYGLFEEDFKSGMSTVVNFCSKLLTGQ